MFDTKMPRRSRSPQNTSFSAFRIGFGYDIHRFASGRPFILGGVRIPSAIGLDGHSDADVLLHAICDALLGAAALGDIGVHFPNTDQTYRNISSLRLLELVRKKVADAGFEAVNIDATVILETPKIMHHAARMRRAIARQLKIPHSSVSIKATTNEGLGAVGRREGCAAMAVTLIRSLA